MYLVGIYLQRFFLTKKLGIRIYKLLITLKTTYIVRWDTGDEKNTDWHVEEVKIGPYADDWCSGKPIAPDNAKASRYRR